MSDTRSLLRRVALLLMPWYSESEVKAREQHAREARRKAIRARNNLQSYARISRP